MQLEQYNIKQEFVEPNGKLTQYAFNWLRTLILKNNEYQSKIEVLETEIQSLKDRVTILEGL